LKQRLDDALSKTTLAWPPLRVAFGWVHQVAHVLANHEASDGQGVRRRLSGLVGAMTRHRQSAAELAGAVEHFLKVTRSYWPGLFHCYDSPDLPRTNNDLEQFFGRHRYHERRTTGRKAASPSLALRGSVRLLAAAATRERVYSARELAIGDRRAWSAMRDQLNTRRERRIERHRFRRCPETYLLGLELQLLQSALPA
jgi:hypothetical protein